MPSKKPVGLMAASAVLIGVFVFSVFPILPSLFSQGLREGFWLEGKNFLPWASSLLLLLLKTLLFVAAVGVFTRRESFRRLLFFSCALCLLAFPWLFPLSVFEPQAQAVLRQMRDVVASCSLDPSILMPSFAAVAYLVFYAASTAFFLGLILYLCRPAVKEWFRQNPGDGEKATELA